MASFVGEMATISDADILEAFNGGSLSIFISHSASREILEGLLIEANRLGIEFTVFFMDDGANLLADSAWIAGLPEGRYAACDLSARSRGIESPERIVAGGQYQNAIMIHDAAHVVSL